MKLNLILSFLAVTLFTGCQSEDNKGTAEAENSTASNTTEAQYPAYFKEVLQAHGGVEQWNKFGTMQYQITSNGNTEKHLIDLKSRKDLIKAENYTIGYDGEQVWVSPNKEAYPGNSARFYHNVNFYFFAIPFVLTDPGVNFEQLDDMTLQNKNYKAIGVTFSEGVGDSPEDKYRLLIDPETNRIEWLLYTVTFFDGQPSEKFNALKYENYQDHKGLLFPHKLSGYKFENGEIGDVRNSVTLEKLELKEGQPEQQQFEKPQNAEVDSMAT